MLFYCIIFYFLELKPIHVYKIFFRAGNMFGFKDGCNISRWPTLNLVNDVNTWSSESDAAMVHRNGRHKSSLKITRNH